MRNRSWYLFESQDLVYMGFFRFRSNTRKNYGKAKILGYFGVDNLVMEGTDRNKNIILHHLSLTCYLNEQSYIRIYAKGINLD